MKLYDYVQNKKHIIWDFDGTLFESYTLITNSMIYALNNQNIRANFEEVYKKCKISLDTAIKFFCDKTVDIAKLKKDRLIYENNNLGDIKPFPGVLNFLENTKKLHIKNYILTHRDFKSLEICLTNYNIFNYFCDFVTSDDPFPRKPNPTSLFAILHRNHIDSVDAIMIGDRTIDADCAINANIDYLLYDPENIFSETSYSYFKSFN